MAHSFDITTDSGLLALIDPDAYAAFVDPDWEFRHLMVHFREQMAKRRMLIWCAGLGAEWTVAVASEPSPRTGFREVTGTIVATGGRLALVSYEELTMAAEDADYVLPPSHEPHLSLANRGRMPAVSCSWKIPRRWTGTRPIRICTWSYPAPMRKSPSGPKYLGARISGFEAGASERRQATHAGQPCVRLAQFQ
jgi:hypothetical protein